MNQIKNHTQNISEGFNYCSSKYENFISPGDVNAKMLKPRIQDFAVFNLKNLIQERTCFKNLERPTVIDHILRNHPMCFEHSGTYDTGLSGTYDAGLSGYVKIFLFD